MKHWIRQNLIAFDQMMNTLFCNGWADETMSSNVYRMEQEGKFFGFLRKVIDAGAFIFFRQREHCRKSYESEKAGNNLPPSLRTNGRSR